MTEKQLEVGVGQVATQVSSPDPDGVVGGHSTTSWAAAWRVTLPTWVGCVGTSTAQG